MSNAQLLLPEKVENQREPKHYVSLPLCVKHFSHCETRALLAESLVITPTSVSHSYEQIIQPSNSFCFML